MDKFTTLKEFEEFIWRHEIPSDQISDAVDRLMALTFPEENLSEPSQTEKDKDEENTALSVPHQNPSSTQTGAGQENQKPRHYCKTCGKTFSRKNNLRRHERTHNGKKDHQCPQCKKTFTRKSDLERHVNIHKRRGMEREYRCGVCDEVFTNKAPFNAHVKQHHQQTKKRKLPSDASGSNKSKKVKLSTTSKDPQKVLSPTFVEDPTDISSLPPDPQITSSEYQRHWNQIRTRFARNNRLANWYNFRLSSLQPDNLITNLQDIFHDQSTVFKLNISFGYILRNTETNALQYHYASRNNNNVFESPFLVAKSNDLHPIENELQNLDILEWAKQGRPTSKWVVDKVTNITFFITKVRGFPIGRGNSLPHYIVENRGVVPLDCEKKTGKPFQDNLCFFRALSLHNGCHVKNLERDTKHYYERYRESHPCSDEDFSGVTLKELPELEKLFEVNIFVYSLEPSEDDDQNNNKPNITAHLVLRSFRQYPSTLYLNLYENHFSYISDLKIYSKSFCCSRCGKYFNRADNHRRHERTCEAKVRYTFPGGVYKIPKSVFDLLEDEAIAIPRHLKFFPYRATFDFECMFNHDDHPNNTAKLQWQAKHVPISVSVCSNVPQYTLPRCFVSTGDCKQLVQDMVDYLIEISQESYRLMQEQFAEVFRGIDEKIGVNGVQVVEDDEYGDRGIDVMESDDDDGEDIESETEEDRAFLDDDDSMEEEDCSFYRALNQELGERKPLESGKKEQKRPHPLVKLKVRLEDFLKELPVVGFNSGKYDLNAVKEFLIPVLVEHEHVQCAIKRNNNFMSLKTEHLKFLDVTNFLAPGFSYDKFLKAYECPQTKGFFPYEWVDSLDKLDQTSLPPHQAFYSSLINKNISDQEYQYCQQVWAENNMQTFKDFLIWYNNLDVEPFCEALEKMCSFWEAKNIDMLRQGISIPGVTLTYLFMTLEPGIYFSLFDERNKDLYSLFKSNMVGGPSLIFHRYHEKDKTKLREHELGDRAKLCQNIVGYDANALYLWAIMQDMPTGFYTRRREETGFKKETSLKMATQWLEWEAHQRNISIRHNMNDTEKRVGDRLLPVDGFHGPSNTVFQFHGCWWHGHDCHLNRGKTMNEKRKKPMADLLQETHDNSQYIDDQGYHLEEMWECQWRDLKRTTPEIKQFLASRFERPLDKYWTLTQPQIAEAVKNGSLFGCVECDIQVPDHLKDHFSEMCPIFKNTMISRDDIGHYMKAFAEEHKIMPQPRRSLIGSFFGKQMLLATPLLKWYLEHGLEVTRVYQVIEYTPTPCFQPFGEAVSDARRAGDAEPNKAIIAETMKLVGNSSYGKTITDQERHRDVKFCQEAKASQLINSYFFRQIDTIDENTYEVQSCKKKIKLNLPMQIGFFVYQYAKLRMLQFYYDFIDKYLDRSDFQYCEMDTDSAYIALAGNSVEELVRLESKEEFEQDKSNWFPRTDTPEHKAYDKRTPGLFKEEWVGEGIIGLCSKTYYCFGSYDKYSCKGVSKKSSEINKDKYLNVLLTKESSAGLNKGFRVVNNSIYTYNQIRDGFSYFYPKRKVLDDGISTVPLDI